jgi:hypothetical protein
MVYDRGYKRQVMPGQAVQRSAGFGILFAPSGTRQMVRSFRQVVCVLVEEDAMKRFVIERDIPAVGSLEREQLRAAAEKSNQVLHRLGSDIQWLESFVATDKTFCVYLARDEDIIHQHAALSGFPATRVTEIKRMIDPTTAAQ